TVVTTLDRLADEGDTKVAVNKLLVTNFEFSVTLVAIEHLLSALVPLSNMLQAKDCDLLHAAKDTWVVMVLLQRREMTMKSRTACFRKRWILLVTLTSYPPLPNVMVVNKIDGTPPATRPNFGRKTCFAFRRPLAGRIRNALDAGQLSVLCPKNDGLPRDSIDDVYQAFHACLDVDETIFVRECERWRKWWTASSCPRVSSGINYACKQSPSPKHTTLSLPLNGHADVYGNSRTVVFGDVKGIYTPKKYDWY
ncbi:hypothetical protein MAR_035604, partial [Mya arenaria]